jgi:hypothetical protein
MFISLFSVLHSPSCCHFRTHAIYSMSLKLCSSYPLYRHHSIKLCSAINRDRINAYFILRVKKCFCTNCITHKHCRTKGEGWPHPTIVHLLELVSSTFSIFTTGQRSISFLILQIYAFRMVPPPNCHVHFLFQHTSYLPNTLYFPWFYYLQCQHQIRQS